MFDYSEELIEEASKWVVVKTTTKDYFGRNSDEPKGSHSEEFVFEMGANNMVVEDGKLVGFKLYGVQDVIKYPDGKLVYTDSYSSYDWEESVYEKEVYELRLKEDKE